MSSRQKLDKSQWMIARERLRLTDPKQPPSEPDLSLRPAIDRLFTKLDSQAVASIHKIIAKWKVMAGETVAAHSSPSRLNENILYVDVDSSTWLAEISRFHSREILRRIQKEIGADTVKGLKFQVNPPRRGQSA